MKTTIKFSILALLAAFSLSSCTKDRIKGTGATVSETFTIANFSKVNLDFSADVNYVYDKDYYVSVDAQQNVIDQMDIEKNGSTLCLKFKTGTHLVKFDKVTFTIHSPSFEGGNVSGSGDLYVRGGFKSTNLNLDVSGSGKIDIQTIETDNVDATISGSGKMEVHSGTATSINSKISGSGKILLEDLEAQDVTTKTSGSGTTKVWATNKLNAKITGSGDVYYRGNPSTTVDITGSGKVKRLN